MNLISAGVKTFSMLLLVLALLVGVLYCIKRFSLKHHLEKGDVGIQLLASLSLSTRDRIQVVEISGERIVLGVSPGGITCITKLGGRAVEEQKGGQGHHDSDV